MASNPRDNEVKPNFNLHNSQKKKDKKKRHKKNLYLKESSFRFSSFDDNSR